MCYCCIIYLAVYIIVSLMHGHTNIKFKSDIVAEVIRQTDNTINSDALYLLLHTLKESIQNVTVPRSVPNWAPVVLRLLVLQSVLNDTDWIPLHSFKIYRNISTIKLPFGQLLCMIYKPNYSLWFLPTFWPIYLRLYGIFRENYLKT